MLCGISPGFPRLSPTEGQVSHVLLTRSPLYSRSCPRFLVRLACVRHAASVDSEPGSNSRLKPEFAPRQGQRDLPPALETRMTIFCEIRSVLNPSMPLTTDTFNLLSKTKSGHRTKRAVSVERASPEGRSRVLETCQLFWPNPSNIPRCSADCQPSSRSELFTFS